MSTKRIPLYSCEQARLIDRDACQNYGFSGDELMERAGNSAFSRLRKQWPNAQRLCVVCGSGNNGGDGLVLARLARKAGMNVRLFLVGNGPREGTEASQALARWHAAGGQTEKMISPLPEADVYIDAVLGIGLKRAPEGDAGWAVKALEWVSPVLSLDVPSGVDADTGHCPGSAVIAFETVTFIVCKQGLYTGHARDHVGTVWLETLDLPQDLLASQRPTSWLRHNATVMPPRQQNSHKGDNGRVLVIGGSTGFSGAVRMAGEAALRVGAGLVTIATHPSHASMLNIGRWELIVHSVSQGSMLREAIQAADVIAVGPGLSTDFWGQDMWQAIAEARCPMVVDADALNLLARAPYRSESWVLTPHPGEAARLLGLDTGRVQSNRFEAVKQLATRYGGSVVLKGAGTIVQTDKETVICGAGNPGMASAGMGDVLTGVIAGLIAQGYSHSKAAEEGVCIHALAGDRAAIQGGERGLLATDLLPSLRSVVNGID